MNPNLICDMLRQHPFIPFRVLMSSGETYEIRHPEMALLTQGTLFIALPEAEEVIPTQFKICSLLHVTALEPTSTHGARPAA